VKGSSLIILVVIVIAFYALMILPQRKQQKKKAEMMRKLAPGAKVLTASGIFGQVMEIRESAIVMKIAERVEVEMDPRAVVRVVSDGHTLVEARHGESESVNEEETTND
jgi:preprotein translocase subunit YajC